MNINKEESHLGESLTTASPFLDDDDGISLSSSRISSIITSNPTATNRNNNRRRRNKETDKVNNNNKNNNKTSSHRTIKESELQSKKNTTKISSFVIDMSGTVNASPEVEVEEDFDDNIVGVTVLKERGSSQQMAAQVVIDADEKQAAEEAHEQAAAEAGGVIDDLLKEKAKESKIMGMVVEPVEKTKIVLTSAPKETVSAEYERERNLAVGIALADSNPQLDVDVDVDNDEEEDGDVVPPPTVLKSRPSDVKHKPAVPDGMVSEAVAPRTRRPSRRTSAQKPSTAIPAGMTVEPVSRESNKKKTRDEDAKAKERAINTLMDAEPVKPASTSVGGGGLPAPHTSKLQRDSTSGAIATTPTSDGVLERGDTAAAAAASIPGLDRADARTLQARPGALRVTPQTTSTYDDSRRRQADENLEYENAPETAPEAAAAVAATGGTNNNNGGDGPKDEEIAAELIDEQTDRKRLQETLEGVLKTQNAVQVVDVEAEDRLKRERQRRTMICYIGCGIVMTVVIIVAVVVSIKNNEETIAPTQMPSESPTMAPTSRASAVEEAVMAGFGFEESPADADSPQAQAIDWMTNEDQTLEFPIEDEDTQNEFNDRYAAAVLAISTGYEYWIDNTGWLDPQLSVCDGWKGLTCNDDGRIGVLDLSVQNLTGTIPTEIGVMDNLDFLFMFRNALYGTLPTELGNLDDVDYFYLNENQLTGTLPAELSGLLDADDLFLFGNQLTGSIPDSFGNLIDVNNLYLNDNKLNGTIPKSLSQLKQIRQLYLQNNRLYGKIPSELGGVISLERLLLANNALAGEIPSELGSFLALEVLTLQKNVLSGSMPEEICRRLEGTIDTLEVLEADCINGEPVNCTCCTKCW